MLTTIFCMESEPAEMDLTLYRRKRKHLTFLSSFLGKLSKLRFFLVNAEETAQNKV